MHKDLCGLKYQTSSESLLVDRSVLISVDMMIGSEALFLVCLLSSVSIVITQGCEAHISGPGPLNREELAFQLSVLAINDTHPAVVRCHVTCLNQEGIYRPVLGLVITSQGKFIEVSQSWRMYSQDGSYSDIHVGDVSYCDAQNNHTMEFEYLIHSSSFNLIDHAVVACGVQVYVFEPDSGNSHSQHTCLGQPHGIIRYQYSDSESAPTASTILASTHDHATSTAELFENDSEIDPGKDKESDRDGFEFEWLIVIMIGIMLTIVILLLTAGFLYMLLKSHRKNVTIPRCVQTVEQPGEKAVKEKETSLDEEAKRSLIQVELDRKLPDTISSRSSKTSCTQV